MQGLLGSENGLAVRGSLLHMVNHSLIKLVLFMAAGVVFMNIHKLDLNEIRGFGHKKPLLHFIFLMGALGIGGIPFWNGYISKTLIHEAKPFSLPNRPCIPIPTKINPIWETEEHAKVRFKFTENKASTAPSSIVAVPVRGDERHRMDFLNQRRMYGSLYAEIICSAIYRKK